MVLPGIDSVVHYIVEVERGKTKDVPDPGMAGGVGRDDPEVTTTLPPDIPVEGRRGDCHNFLTSVVPRGRVVESCIVPRDNKVVKRKVQ